MPIRSPGALVRRYPKAGTRSRVHAVAPRKTAPSATTMPSFWRPAPTACSAFPPRTSSYQREAAERLHLPFPLLSDAALRLTTALKLPVMLVDGATLLKRMALIIDDGVITHVFYPVFPPDRNAPEVLAWLRAQSA